MFFVSKSIPLRFSNTNLQDAKLDHEKTLLSRQVETADGAIDKLVYELYGLTEEEIKIVEGTGGKPSFGPE